MKISSIYLLAAFILILLIGLPPATYGAKPSVTGIMVSSITIDLGSEAGFKEGMKATVSTMIQSSGKSFKSKNAIITITKVYRMTSDALISAQTDVIAKQ